MVQKTKLSAQEYLNRIELQEEEYEKEIRFMVKKIRGQVQREKIETETLKRENEKLNIEKLGIDQKDEQKQKKIEHLIVENTLLMEKKVSLCLSLLKMQEQLLEREQAILNKEKTIQNSRDTEKALENYRSILREKIIFLKKNKDKVINDTVQKENSLAMMFQELVRETKMNHKFIAKNSKMMAKKLQLVNGLNDLRDAENLLTKKKQLVFDRLDNLISRNSGKENKFKENSDKKLKKSPGVN